MDDPVPNSSRPRGRLNIWRAAGTILSLALLVYLVWLQGWDEFAQALRQLPLGVFLAALGMALVSRMAISLRWYALLRSAGVKMPFGQCLRLVFMGLFASNFLPSTVGGDLVRLAGAVYLRVDAGISAASLLVDRLIGMAGMALMAPIGLSIILNSSALPGTGLTAPLLPLMAGLLPPDLFRRLWRWALGFIKKLLSSAAFWLRHPASLGLPFLCTLCHMAMTFWLIQILLAGMGEHLSFWWIGGLWSLSYFISLAPISVNGLGLQEVSIAYLYSQFAGISMHTALALAVLLRLIFLLCSLPGVIFLPDILRPLPAMNPSSAEKQLP
jgi:uncharacterized membrane protein YbhN (UPF0104 family)